ncbi:hypothetical protein [Bacillus sp. 165]|uniref:hypothetical protein n=1 Tax=Bacillus sp. 165 TaxID=1529117 RepID=UPI001ADC43D9|nr:hypothetical protein [Bacillus sp. 165]MBO9131219.1 hypothetical protein [Bacillus sp. 165]
MRYEDKDKDTRSLVETMDQYEKIMKRIAVNRLKPSRPRQLKIEGVIHTQMDREEFLNEFIDWLNERQGSGFVGTVQEEDSE